MKPILTFLVSLLTPIALIGLAVRILLTPLYYNVEYSMPYFPVDTYGFTKEDRLRWAPFAVEYLLNSEDISYLGDLEFDDGTLLYGKRELVHMQDVKNVVQGTLRVWYISLAILAVIAILAWRGRWLPSYLGALRRGGHWMIGFALILGTIVGVGIVASPDLFWQFFTFFHSLFFEGDSWLFPYSDTLIRLFPIRFWQDAFLWTAVIALGGGLALASGLRRYKYT
ncbi:MAG: TIGR01906 family membrane protein [Chloroflexota bacterium]